MSQRDIVSGAQEPSLARNTAGSHQTLWRGALIVFVVTLTPGGGAGVADDVDVFADGGAFGDGKAPLTLEILDVRVDVETAAVGSSVKLCSEPGGAGTLHTGALSTAATGIVRESGAGFIPQPDRTVYAGDPLYAQRSDRSVTGRITITARSLATE